MCDGRDDRSALGVPMGWEWRGNRMYLYYHRRVNGRPVREYVGKDDEFTRLLLTVDPVREQHERARDLVRRSWERWRERMEALVGPAAAADATVRAGIEVVLVAAGLHRPGRKAWRKMRRAAVSLKLNRLLLDKIEKSLGQLKATGPLIQYSAPQGDPVAVAMFEAARRGDAAAVAKLPELIRQRGWVEWIGNIAWQATRQIIARIAGGDPVLEAGLTAKARALWVELAGPDPSPLEKVLVQRIVNGWLTTHALEAEQAIRPPSDPKSALYLDRRVSQAQRRLAEACRTLASVRRLNVTVVMNVAGKQQVNVGK